MRRHTYYVYILTNRSRTLYVGVTNDLTRRLAEHRARPPGSFCKRYNIDTLVYFEVFQWIQDAIAREKVLKGWSRAKKVRLIEQENPQWRDLSDTYGDPSGPGGPSG
ncbi:MAG TPA: GIY-YIG nuclease family protein [Gemmatimonadales bacterium]|nr:GIY-YIG nuclease family protein [Gemmatimonadales bacterium]